MTSRTQWISGTRFWKDPQVKQRLTELWRNPDIPASEIAKLLSKEFGVDISTNSVIGKVHRLGLHDEYPRHNGARVMQIRGRNGTAMSPAMRAQQRERRLLQIEQQRAARAATVKSETDQHGRVLAAFRPATVQHEMKRGDDGKLIPTIPELPEEEPDAPFVLLTGVSRTACRWPMPGVDDDGVSHLCGQKSAFGAYCARHAAIGYVRPPSASRMERFWCV